MAISVNPQTHVIFVPKADLTLIQASPEVRELDLNAFRLWLKDWEDDEEGIIQPKTHTHNTEVTLSGLNYARIVSILPPYSVEFEDAQYVINCVGANHNLADVKVENQSSLIVNNAAGLINNTAIEHSSFNGVVTIDVLNGVAGTLYPTGTHRRPSNNLADTMLIDATRGFGKIQVQGDLTVDAGGDYSGKVFIGDSQTKTTLTIASDANVTNCEFEYATITGVLDGGSVIRNCLIGDLTYVNGHIYDSGLYGTIYLGGNEDAILSNCVAVNPMSSPVVDMGGSGQSLTVANYFGDITIKNLSSASEHICIGLNAGQVTLDSTITDGLVTISGVGTLINNSSVEANTDGLISRETITKTNWETVYVDTSVGLPGTDFPLGTGSNPVSNMADAKLIAAANGLHKFHVDGSVQLLSSFAGYTFEGDNPKTCTLDLNGQNVENCSFYRMTLSGQCNGAIYSDHCILSTGMTMLEGTITNGFVVGSVTITTNITFKDTDGGGPTGATLTYTAAGDVIGGADMSGQWTIAGAVGGPPPCAAFLGLSSGAVTFDASCVGGVLTVTGTGRVVDNSTATVYDYTTSALTWDEQMAGHQDPGSMGANQQHGVTSLGS